MSEVFAEPELWVAAAFAIFLAIMFMLRVPHQAISGIDGRRARIKSELEEASRLRQEAEAVLAEYKRKQKDVEQVVEEMMRDAREEAARFAAEEKARVEDLIARRKRMAEAKIARAEAQAIADLRAAAVDAAVAAAAKVLAETARGETAETLIEQGIRDIKAKLA
jgi:F-type H+-transporting ATPase subunit b